MTKIFEPHLTFVGRNLQQVHQWKIANEKGKNKKKIQETHSLFYWCRMIWSWKFGALGFVGEWNEVFANVVFSSAQKYFCWLDSKKRRYEKFGNLHEKESLNFVEVSPAGRADTKKPWNLLVFLPAREWVVLEFVIFDRSVSRRWIFLSTGVLS